MNIIYRKSSANDLSKISTLLEACFGDMSVHGALDNLESRYLLAFDGDELIAMTGLIHESAEFSGSEIDWTCIYQEYKNQGIMTNMLETILDGVEKNVFCSCMKLYGNQQVNLLYAMSRLGFNCTLKNYKRYDSNITKACDICQHKKEPHCTCCEDVFVRLYTAEK